MRFADSMAAGTSPGTKVVPRRSQRMALAARAALAIAAVALAAPAEALNKTANYGFETGTTGVPPSWTAGGTAAATQNAFGRITTDFNTGAASFQGRWTSTGNNQAVNRTISQTFTTTAPVNVSLRGFYKRTGTGTVDSFAFRIALRETSATGTTRTGFTYTNPVNSQPPTDATWQDTSVKWLRSSTTRFIPGCCRCPPNSKSTQATKQEVAAVQGCPANPHPPSALKSVSIPCFRCPGMPLSLH